MSREEAIIRDKKENHNKVIRSKNEEPREGMAGNIPVATDQSGSLPSGILVISFLTHVPHALLETTWPPFLFQLLP